MNNPKRKLRILFITVSKKNFKDIRINLTKATENLFTEN